MVTKGVSLKTFNNWRISLDPGDVWIRGETVDNAIVRITCALCVKHFERLRGFRNFSDAFINGVTGPCLKRDCLTKHVNSSAHQRAESLEKGALPISELFRTTPIG